MRLLDRYIWRAVAKSTLLALFVLVSIYFLIDLLTEFGKVGKGSYTMLKALQYMLLSVPRSLYDFFPTAALVGGMMSLGQLAAGGELVAMRAAGVSVASIVGAIFKLGIALAIVLAMAGDWVVPFAESHAEVLRSTATKGQARTENISDFWVKLENRVISIGKIYPDERLGGIRIYEFDGQRMRSAIRARQGSYDEQTWLLEDVQRSNISEQAVQTVHSVRERVPSPIPAEFFRQAAADPDRLTTLKLREHIRFLKDNGFDASRKELSLWTRLSVPLSCPLMLLIAAPFAFGPVRSGGAGQRLFLGALMGLALHLISRIFGNLALVLKLSPAVGAVAPLFLFLMFGLMALKRAR